MNQGHVNVHRSDPSISVNDGGVGTSNDDRTGQVTTDLEETWARTITRVGGARVTPSDACWTYLQQMGIAQDGSEVGTVLNAEYAPLKGQRWYMCLSISGQRGEFLVDTGASHTLIGRDFISRLGNQSDVPVEGIKARTATGDAMKTYGRTVKPMLVDGKTYWICPTIADITDDGILGMDFAALYGVTMNTKTGMVQIKNPYKQTVKCVLRMESAIASVVQRTHLPPKHVSNILVSSVGVQRERPGVFEPMVTELGELGLEGFHTFVANGRWTVVPICNPTDEVITLEGGTPIGTTSTTINGSEVTEEFVRVSSTKGSVEDSSVPKVTDLPKHLMPLLSESHLEDYQMELIKTELLKYTDVFTTPGDPLGRTDKVQHRIDTGDTLPVRLPYRRLPMAKRSAMESEVEKMLEEDIITPSESPWSSPVVMVTKKDGSCRFCIDYRKLNGVTRKNAYPLPRIDECVESLGGARWFCTLDLQSGYWQIGMHPDHREKTAFATHMGLFEFNVMPFGLCNAPATFEAMMETMLRGILWKKCLVYLDDIIVFGGSVGQCLSNLQAVLDRLRAYGLKLKPTKCKLFREEVEYLGRIVSRHGVSADPGKIKVVSEWPRPEDTKEIRSFIGFCSYYRDFIPGFSQVAAPLQALMIGEKKTKTKIIWSPAAEQSFMELKRLFSETPVLHYPAQEGIFILDTDASNESIGAALSQVQDGKEVPLAFSSNSLSKAQRNYCTTKRELLAVVVYTKKYRHFLYGGNFVLRTDHSALQWLLNFKDAEGMMGRWLNHLSEFGVTNNHMEHRAGVKHINADSLSRRPIRKCQRIDCTDCGAHNAVIASVGAVIPNWTLQTMKDEQERDIAVSILYSWKLLKIPKPVRPALSVECKEVRQLVAQWDDLFIKDSVLCRWRTQPGKRRVIQLVVPEALRLQILNYCHGHRTSAHFGRERTEMKIKSRYYWPGMTGDIRRWVRQCPTCCMAKPGPGMGKLPLSQELFGVRFARIALDIISGFKTTPRGNTCMMVVQDYYTKYVAVYPLPNHTAVTCASTLFDNWILTWGGPLMLHSDQGREFESNLWREMCAHTHICKTHTNPYRPQSDGQVERFNRTLIECLTTMVNSHQDDWDEQARYIVHAYNASEHASTGCSPNLLVMGEEIIMPSDMVYGVQRLATEMPCTVMFVEALRHTLREAYGVVRSNLETHAKLQKVGYDTGLKDRRFNVGDLVVRYSTPQSQHKALFNWDGPHEITRVVSETTVIIRSTHGKLYKSHVARLRPWLGVPHDDLGKPLGKHRQQAVDALPTPGDRAQVPTAPEPSVIRAGRRRGVKTKATKGKLTGKAVSTNRPTVTSRPRGRPRKVLPDAAVSNRPAGRVVDVKVRCTEAITPTAGPLRRSERIRTRSAVT